MINADENLRIGGLLRCCVETWREARDEGELADISALACVVSKSCGASMRRNPDDDVWEWNR